MLLHTFKVLCQVGLFGIQVFLGYLLLFALSWKWFLWLRGWDLFHCFADWGKINLIFNRVIQCPYKMSLFVQSCRASDTKPVGIKDNVILASSFITKISEDKKLELTCNS